MGKERKVDVVQDYEVAEATLVFINTDICTC
jgi:hypothetical protein